MLKALVYFSFHCDTRDMDGTAEGWEVGSAEGCRDGFGVGRRVRSIPAASGDEVVGEFVGFDRGRLLGLTEGRDVGCAKGCEVGRRLG